MSHSHSHDPATGNIKVAFFLNLFFTIIEIIGGLFTNSVAILSDALHDLGDSLSLGLAWYFQKISKKGRDRNFSYGYKRFSLLGAIINSVILVVGSIYILIKAIPRLISPEQTEPAYMIGIAIIGIVVNGLAVLKLKKGTSMNEQVVSLHLLEDVLGWIAVLVGSIIMYFFDWYIIDPILSIIITGYILFNVFKNIKKTLEIVLQAIPKGVSEAAINKFLLSKEEVLNVHDLHIWSLDGEYNILTAHLVVNKKDDDLDLEQVKNNIRQELKNMNINHATLELEDKSAQCELENC